MDMEWGAPASQPPALPITRSSKQLVSCRNGGPPPGSPAAVVRGTSLEPASLSATQMSNATANQLAPDDNIMTPTSPSAPADKRRSALQLDGKDEYTGMTGWSSKTAMKATKKVKRNAEKAVHSQRCIIDPRTSKFTHYWEYLTGLALGYVTIATPFEVGIMINSGCGRYGTMWWINRVVDVLFLVDMSLQFVTKVELSRVDGSRWTSNHRAIAYKYFTSWFLLDFVSLGSAVFDIAPQFCPPENAFDNLAAAGGRARILRLFRLTRLTKLARLVRGSKVFRHLMANLGMTSGTQTIVEISFGVSVITHWLACFLVLQITLMNRLALDSWLGRFGYCWVAAESLLDPAGSKNFLPAGFHLPGTTQCLPNGALYTRSLNWAIMLVTGMDHKPPMGPAKPFCYVDWATRNQFDLKAVQAEHCTAELDDAEIFIITIITLVTAMMWTLVTAKIVDVVTNTDPDEHEFKQNLDDLNQFMEHHDITDASTLGTPGLRVRLREYVHQTQHLRRMQARSRVQGLLSPQLQAEVAITVNAHWHERVPFFRDAAHGFLVRVSLSLSARVFPPAEIVAPTCLYIMHTGVALVAGKLLMRGHVFGIESLLYSHFLARFSARAMTYIDTYCILPDAMYDFAAMYPRTNYDMKKWIAFRALSNFLIANLYEDRRERRFERVHRARDSNAGKPAKYRSSSIQGMFKSHNSSDDTDVQARKEGRRGSIDRVTAMLHRARPSGSDIAPADASPHPRVDDNDLSEKSVAEELKELKGLVRGLLANANPSGYAQPSSSSHGRYRRRRVGKSATIEGNEAGWAREQPHPDTPVAIEPRSAMRGRGPLIPTLLYPGGAYGTGSLQSPQVVGRSSAVRIEDDDDDDGLRVDAHEPLTQSDIMRRNRVDDEMFGRRRPGGRSELSGGGGGGHATPCERAAIRISTAMPDGAPFASRTLPTVQYGSSKRPSRI